MRRLACLAGCVALAGAALQGSEAAAAPRALLDAERAEDVAVAGGEVLVAATTAGGGARLTAVPAAGGPARVVLDLPRRGRGWRSVTRLASSAQLTAMLVAFVDLNDNFRDWRVYAGPPAGPLALVQRVRHAGRRPVWTPVDMDVHGDRLLVQELRQPRFAFRLVVRAPDGTAPPVPQDRLASPAAIAGEQIAYVGRSLVRFVDWRTGQLSGSMDLGRNAGDIEDRHLDMTDGARVVTAIEGRLLTGAPGVPVQELHGSGGVSGLTAPRFAGQRVAALAPARRGAQRPVLIDPAAGTLRSVGPPSTTLSAIAAGEATVAWLANGCVLAADVVEAPPPGIGPWPLDPAPPGPCPRAEVTLDEHDQVLRGRTLRVAVTCVAAPPPGCAGTVTLGRGAGQARFRVAPGRRQVVPVRLSRRGMASVRRQLGLDSVALLRLGARVTDGRVSREAGTDWVLIDPRR